jgi:hypothetical protein
MRVRNYLKKKCEATISGEMAQDILGKKNMYSKKSLLFCSIALLLIVALSFVVLNRELKDVAVVESSDMKLVSAPIAATATKTSVITIPSGTVKANPFLPYRDISGSSKALDVPAYNLVEPPETVETNSDAARVMDTIVSGILFDKFSPSAILNIEGNDYLVKKGDVVNNYKVVNIAQDSVTVKLGANVYKAGIGEILTEGTLNYNSVSNLENKFGGER